MPWSKRAIEKNRNLMLRKNVLETEEKKTRKRLYFERIKFLSLLAHHATKHTNNPPNHYCPQLAILPHNYCVKLAMVRKFEWFCPIFCTYHVLVKIESNVNEQRWKKTKMRNCMIRNWAKNDTLSDQKENCLRNDWIFR